MKIGVKQGIVIGALVLAGGGLLLRGAWADPSPQPVPLANPAAQALTVNPPTGTGDSIVSPQTYPDQVNSGTPVAPQGTYGFGGYGGMMGGYGGYGSGYGGGYGGMMGGYCGYGSGY